MEPAHSGSCRAAGETAHPHNNNHLLERPAAVVAPRRRRDGKRDCSAGSHGALRPEAAVLVTATAALLLAILHPAAAAAAAAAAAGPTTAGSLELRASTDSCEHACERPNELDPKAVFNLGCRRFKWMCIDQQQFITYDPQYDPASSIRKVPTFDVRDIVYNWPNPWGNGDKFERGRGLHVPPVSIRARTSQEASPDLREPVFSTCTLPIILWQRWMFNVGEVFEASYVRLYEEFAAGRVDPRLSLVVATPHGLRQPDFMQLLFGAIFTPKVTTLAELSQRPPPDDAHHQHLPRSTTREGRSSRCFTKLYLCAIKTRKDDGHCAAGAHLLRQYEGRLPPVNDLFHPEGDADALKVVLASRPNATGRAILNEEELLQACNQMDLEQHLVSSVSASTMGRRGLGGAFRRRRLKCVSHVFGRDLMYDLALAKAADVLVTTHGAVGYYSFYMGAGTSLVEVMPYKFPAAWANLYFARMLEFEKKVFYWSIWITDPANSHESAFENAAVFRPEFRHRERHVTLPWAALRRHLETILQVAGRPMSYKRVYMAGEHSISDTLQRVPHQPDTRGEGWASYNGPPS
ncbi:hypothetical protein PLESTF_000109200 [Pleodorina starrii]|nr:hypothetical protein PLESTF_000109200 [Pleodorina starrii]